MSNFFLTSCIYEGPRGDNFHRTLRESEDPSSDITDDGSSGMSYNEASGNSYYDFSDMTADRNMPRGLTTEFLRGGSGLYIEAAIGSFGQYHTDGKSASFIDLTLQYKRDTIILEEGKCLQSYVLMPVR